MGETLREDEMEKEQKREDGVKAMGVRAENFTDKGEKLNLCRGGSWIFEFSLVEESSGS